MKLYTHKDWKGKYLYLNENFEQDDRQGKYLNIDKEEVVLCWNNLMDEITFQEAFSDEIEVIIRQYIDAYERIFTVNGKAIKSIDEAYEANSKLKAELEEKTKYLNQSRHKNIELNLFIKELQSKIDDLKIERDQLVIDCNETENRCNEFEKAFRESQSELLKKKFDLEESYKNYDKLESKVYDSELVHVSIKIEESANNKDWEELVSDTTLSIESDTQSELFKVWAERSKFIRVKLVNKSIDYKAINQTNDEYALKSQIKELTQENEKLKADLSYVDVSYKEYLDKFESTYVKNESLKLAIDKLSDLAVKFYLKSEGITI